MVVSIDILKVGYSVYNSESNIMKANCTCTLIRDGKIKVIVDTLTAWDSSYLLKVLEEKKLHPNDVTHVVCTHGHSDHVGNLNLFTNALHVVGQSISQEDNYILHSFEKPQGYINQNQPDCVCLLNTAIYDLHQSGRKWYIELDTILKKISENIKVVATPGHTLSDVSIIVKDTSLGTVAVVGDLFEREEDIKDLDLWEKTAGSENPCLQYENRQKMLLLADYIIPGHGPGFQVSDELRKCHENQQARFK